MDAFDSDASEGVSPGSPRGGGRPVRLKVLLVDDKRESRAVLTAMISLLEASVVPVAGAREALEALSQQRFDVLVSDIELAGRSGYELVRAIRELGGPQSSLPAIAVTGHDTPEDRIRAQAAGFAAHLAKPVDMQALFTAIRELRAGPSELPARRPGHVPGAPGFGSADHAR